MFGGDNSDLGSTNVAKNGLYGAGRYGYTLNDQSVDVTAGNTTVATASMVDLNYDSRYTSSLAANELIKITIAHANISSTIDKDAIKAFTVGDEVGGNIKETIGEFSHIAGANAVFIVSASEDAGLDAVSVNFANVPAAENRGDFEDRSPCLLYTSPSPRDVEESRMPSSA